MAKNKWVTGVIVPKVELFHLTYNWFLGPACGDDFFLFLTKKSFQICIKSSFQSEAKSSKKKKKQEKPGVATIWREWWVSCWMINEALS